jgi:hypothetical protein
MSSCQKKAIQVTLSLRSTIRSNMSPIAHRAFSGQVIPKKYNLGFKWPKEAYTSQVIARKYNMGLTCVQWPNVPYLGELIPWKYYLGLIGVWWPKETY